jgi:IS5 family transposase
MLPLVSGIEAPRQRNCKEENDQIKEGQIPEKWDEVLNKKRQKDVDTKWTKKNNETHYGYKNHAKVDNKHKFIIHTPQRLLLFMIHKH